MKLHAIGSFEDLSDDSNRWNALLAASAAKNVFLTFEWLKSWWEIFKEADMELLILIAEENGVWAGIAPLYMETGRFMGVIAIRQVRFLGDKYIGSDFLDFISLRGREKEIARLFIDYLSAHPPVRRLFLDDVNEVSIIPREIAVSTPFSNYIVRKYRCPTMSLPATIEEFMQLPDQTFKKITYRRNLKKLYKNHQVRIVHIVDPDEIDAYLTQLFDLHTQRWEMAGRAGLFEKNDNRAFYVQASRAMARQGWLYITALEIDTRIEAIEYGLLYNGIYYSLQSGCSGHGFKLKAGNVLSYRIFEALVGNVSTFHFLRGHEPYKYKWGAQDIHTLRVDAWLGPIGCMAVLALKSKDGAKKAVKALLQKYFSGKRYLFRIKSIKKVD